MSERVVTGDLSIEKGFFCSHFKRNKDISVKKYGLHIESIVKYLVKERFASILVFLKPEASSVA